MAVRENDLCLGVPSLSEGPRTRYIDRTNTDRVRTILLPLCTPFLCPPTPLIDSQASGPSYTTIDFDEVHSIVGRRRWSRYPVVAGERRLSHIECGWGRLVSFTLANTNEIVGYVGHGHVVSEEIGNWTRQNR